MHEARGECLAACRHLEDRFAEHRAAINKETQFNRMVELNTRVKQMETRLLEMVAA